MDTYGAIVMEHDECLVEDMERLDEKVTNSKLSPIIWDFSKEEIQREFLFLDSQIMKEDVAYICIYAQATKSVHIAVDHVATKMLHLLQDVQNAVKVTIFSDNTYNKLAASDYADYQRQFHGRVIIF